MKLFPGYKYYPIKEKNSRYFIETEYGTFEIGKYELRCHECKNVLAFKIEPEEVPRFASIYHNRNVFQPYFHYLSGDCFHGLHGGFSRPAVEIVKKNRQCKLEEWI